MTFKYTGPGYYVTRDGRKALVGEFRSGGYICSGGYVGLIYSYDDTLSGTGGRTNATWYSDGRWVGRHENNHSCDLIGPWMEPLKPLECYVVVHTDGEPCYSNRNKDKAMLVAQGRRVIHMKEVTK